MELVAHYWDYFLQVETQTIQSFVRRMEIYASGKVSLHYYLTYFSTLLILAFLFACEFVFPWRRRQRKLRPGLALDLLYVVINVFLLYVFLGKALIQTLTLMFQDAMTALFDVRSLVVIELDALPMWSRFLLMFLFVDLLGYVNHRVLHHFDFLWQFHKIHHSSTQLDTLNAQRFHFGEQLYWPLFNYLPLALIGFPAGEVLVASLFTTLFSNYTHSNIKIPLGPLRYVVNNPQIHLWHHAAAVDTRRNVNYGDALIIWDYLFGTAYLPDDRSELELGFDDVDAFPTTFWGQLVYPFKTNLTRAAQAVAAPFRARSGPASPS